MTTVQFSIPAPVLEPYTKDDLHDCLKDNPKLAREVVHAVAILSQDKGCQGFEEYDKKFASSLAKQVGEGKKFSWKQNKYLFKFAHKYIEQILPHVNGVAIVAPKSGAKAAKTVVRRRKRK